MHKKKIMIGNDHGGYTLKLVLVKHLKATGYDVEDIGCHSEEIVRYPYYAATISRAVSENNGLRGILICSTGIGMSIIANKFKGIRAALCYNAYQGRMTAAHNDSNILCLGGQCVESFQAIEILEQWLNTPYEGGRHDISLGLVRDVEEINFSGKFWEPNNVQ